MNKNPYIRARVAAGGTAVCLMAAALTACGSGASTPASAPSGNGASPAVSAVADLASKVPAQYRGKTLTVGTDASVPPLEYQTSSGQIIGFEPGLVTAATAVLGLKVKFVDAGFDSLVPGLQNGRYDMLASDMGVHPEREKIFDMVQDFQSGDSIMVRKDSTLKLDGLQSVCGLSVGAQTGSTYLADVQAQSSKCTAAGKKPVDVHSYSDRNAEQLALANGRIDALVTDQGIAEYAVNQLHQNFKVSVSYNVNPCGIAVTKTSGLAQPLKAAIQYLIDNGQYKELVKKWQMGEEAIPKAVVNGIEYQGS